MSLKKLVVYALAIYGASVGIKATVYHGQYMDKLHRLTKIEQGIEKELKERKEQLYISEYVRTDAIKKAEASLEKVMQSIEKNKQNFKENIKRVYDPLKDIFY